MEKTVSRSPGAGMGANYGSDEALAAFEAWMSDDGEFPKAVARDRTGGYLLSQAAYGWCVWRAAWDAARLPPAPKEQSK